MKKRSLNIGMQLGIGFSVIAALLLVLGLVAYSHTQMLYTEAQALYDHPLQVKQALSQLKIDILNTRVGIRDIVFTQDEDTKAAAVQIIQASLEDGEAQFDVMRSAYLGPAADIENAYNAYNEWRGASEYRITLAQHGELTIDDLGTASTVFAYRENLMNAINTIDQFASNKAEELHEHFMVLEESLNIQLFLLCTMALGATVLISALLTRSIRTPLRNLQTSITRFHQGDLSARCGYDRDNELGTLAGAFNNMADAVQQNVRLHQKTVSISKVMLETEETHAFFKEMLAALAEQTGAQMATAYLYNPEQKIFEYYESIGISGKAKDSFDAAGMEGLFGPAIYTGKMQIIKDIPQDTRYVFEFPGYEFVPREIMTLPVFSGRKMLAMISLACVNSFKEGTAQLIEDLMDTMSARIEGVLAYRTIQRFSNVMEEKNRELDAQKEELAAQAAALTLQNSELEMQKGQLQEASRLKTSFLSNMSHELRTPLNSIIALSGVLERRLDGKITGEEHGYLEVIERNGKSLLELINELLDISRIEAGREEINMSEFSMKQLLLEMISTLRPQADQKGVKLLMDSKAPEIKVMSDAGKCRHILQNIIGNAVKFTEKGSVKVALAREGETVKIKVTDTGVGIATEHLQHIFEEFRQADAGTARRFGGTGLGLSIAKKYTQMLGGMITVNSRVGKGSVFEVTLPLFYEENVWKGHEQDALRTEREEKMLARMLDTPTGEQKTLLLIEDSEPAVIQIEDLLRETGHRLLTARSAAQAFELLKTHQPDAIILDLMMPEMDGFETLRTLRESPSTMLTPVLILTAKHITKEDLQTLRRNNIYQLIRKGDVDRLELLDAVFGMLYPQKKEQPPQET